MTKMRGSLWVLGVGIGMWLMSPPRNVWAQGEEGSEPTTEDNAPAGPEPEGGGEAGGETETESEFGEAPQPVGTSEARSAAVPQVSETHSVQGGDTLWDLCGKYLNSPWYWPKIWSYNPQISNPHWIYPGNELRFYPTDENLPTNVEVARGMQVPEGEDLEIPDALDANDLVKTVGTIQVQRSAANSVWTAHVGFVSKAEHERAGQIVNSESESVLLSDFDFVYMKLKTASRRGDSFAVYRTVKEIEHPVTGEPYGYAVEIIGGVTVTDTSPSVATAQISQTFRPIERGDYVGPWPENFSSRIAPTPGERPLKGYVMETVGDVLSTLGEHTMVFIDKGRNEGVQKGNVFTVFSRGDRYTLAAEGLPNEDIGELMVVDVQDDASTAIVTYSAREIAIGDKIELRVGG